MATRSERVRTAGRRSDASEDVALEIRRRLERSDLRPGDRLGSEAELAAEFGVSRPTLREALRLLSATHLIRASQGRNGGIFVASTPNEGMGRNVSESIELMLAAESVSLCELVEARLFLEVPLAGLAARHGDDDVVAALEQAIADAEGQSPGTPPFDEADARFHRVLARAAGNDLLVAFTSWILDVLQPRLIETIGPHVDPARIIDQHRAILRAVRRGQPAAAERAMAAHIGHLRDVVAQVGQDPATPSP